MRRLTLIVAAVLVAACAGGPAGPSPTNDASARASSIATATASEVPQATAIEPTAVATVSPTAAIPSLPPTGVLTPATEPRDFVNQIGEITCSGSIGADDPVAIVGLGDTSYPDYVLRDYSDPAHPRSVCRFLSSIPVLVDARHVVTQEVCTVTDNVRTCVRAIVDLPEVRYHWFKAPATSTGFAYLLAFSRDFGSVAWRLYDQQSPMGRVYLTDRTGDHLVSEFPAGDGRCGYLAKEAAFGASGSDLFVLANSGMDSSSLVVVEGGQVRLALRPPATGWPGGDFVDMAVWSPTSTTLFYSRAAGVFKWTPGEGAQLMLPGVHWRYPTISPDGRYLAYAALTGATTGVYLIDLARATKPVLLHSDRDLPVFLNSEQLFYVSDEAGCGTYGPPTVYELLDQTEYRSVLQGVIAVWPATSAIH